MESHLEDITCFTSFLKDGVEVPFANSQLDEQCSDLLECVSKQKRGCNFTTDEDNLIVSSWLNNSLDAADGHNQKSSSFWKRIQNFYMEWKNPDWQERTVSSLCHRWSIIQKAVNKFCSYLARIESLHKSGVSKEDNIRDAKKMYSSIEKQPFRFDHSWDLLKNEQKWLDRDATIVSCKRKSPMSRSLPTFVSKNATDELIASSPEDINERPIGRKAAKERKKVSKKFQGDASTLLTALSELKDEKRKAHNEKMMSSALSIQSSNDQRVVLLKIQQAQLLEARERNRIKTEKLKFLQSKEDMEIMMKDTSSMTPEQIEYFKIRRMEINRRNLDLNG